jgi:MFS family permease
MGVGAPEGDPRTPTSSPALVRAVRGAVAPYVTIARMPGMARLASAFVALALVTTMAPVVVVLFAHDATGSYADASLVLASFTVGRLVLGPVRGRTVDRIGPARAVWRLAVPASLTDVALIVAGVNRVAPIALIGLAFVSGATTTPANAALRTLWPRLFPDDKRRHTGYAALSMMQEACFIAGPLLAGVIIGVWSPTAALVTMAVLGLAGAVLFAGSGHARAKTPAGSVEGGWPAVLHGRAIKGVVAIGGFSGLTFGLLDVALPAFARAHGSSATVGVLLSALATGLLVGGFVYGIRPPRRPPRALIGGFLLLGAAGVAPLAFATDLPVTVALTFLSGLCFAPFSTCQYAVIDAVAAAGHEAEAYSWFTTLYSVGIAAGVALAGQLIGAVSIRAALAAACAPFVAATVVGLTAVRERTLGPAVS